MTEESVRDNVLKLVQVNFSIKGCPQNIYEEFVTFCREETNDSYSMGLKFLLDSKKHIEATELLLNKIIELEARIEGLEKKPEDCGHHPAQNCECNKKQKTFGSK